jgi:hypothetical protein
MGDHPGESTRSKFLETIGAAIDTVSRTTL